MNGGYTDTERETDKDCIENEKIGDTQKHTFTKNKMIP
jgi:hypothetical protein